MEHNFPCSSYFNLCVVILLGTFSSVLQKCNRRHLFCFPLFVLHYIRFDLQKDKEEGESREYYSRYHWFYFFQLMNDNAYRKSDHVRLAASVLVSFPPLSPFLLFSFALFHVFVVSYSNCLNMMFSLDQITKWKFLTKCQNETFSKEGCAKIKI